MEQNLNLTQLGRQVEAPKSPAEAKLERIPIQGRETFELYKQACVSFSCPEFTSLCPVTHQPDFARIYIDFVPDKFLVESKSLKLFMFSFRNHGAFHEETTLMIAQRLKECLEPMWMRVTGIWFPRGGIPIDIYWQSGAQPNGIYIPSRKLYPYTGR